MSRAASVSDPIPTAMPSIPAKIPPVAGGAARKSGHMRLPCSDGTPIDAALKRSANTPIIARTCFTGAQKISNWLSRVGVEFISILHAETSVVRRHFRVTKNWFLTGSEPFLRGTLVGRGDPLSRAGGSGQFATFVHLRFPLETPTIEGETGWQTLPLLVRREWAGGGAARAVRISPNTLPPAPSLSTWRGSVSISCSRRPSRFSALS